MQFSFWGFSVLDYTKKTACNLWYNSGLKRFQAFVGCRRQHNERNIDA